MLAAERNYRLAGNVVDHLISNVTPFEEKDFLLASMGSVYSGQARLALQQHDSEACIQGSGAGLCAWDCRIAALAFRARPLGHGIDPTGSKAGQCSAGVVVARAADGAPKSDPLGDLGSREARDCDP